MHQARGYFVADTDEIRPQYQTQDAPDANARFTSSMVRDTGLSVGATVSQLDTQVTDAPSPGIPNQVLPFNVTLSGANEYGALCAAKILGVEILNEGSGVSIDDQVFPSCLTNKTSRAGARARPRPVSTNKRSSRGMNGRQEVRRRR